MIWLTGGLSYVSEGLKNSFWSEKNKIRKLFEISSMLLAWPLWASSNLSSSLHLLHCFLSCNHPISCTESFKYQIRLIPRKIIWSFNFQSDIMTSVSLLSKLTEVVYIWSTLLQLTVKARDFLRLKKQYKLWKFIKRQLFSLKMVVGKKSCQFVNLLSFAKMSQYEYVISFK